MIGVGKFCGGALGQNGKATGKLIIADPILDPAVPRSRRTPLMDGENAGREKQVLCSFRARSDSNGPYGKME